MAAPEERRAAILKLIRSAKKRLRVTLFRCNDYQIVDALATAAGRGVMVETLVTARARGGRKRLREIASLLESAGVTVQQYADPVVKYHAKYLVVDDSAAMVASLNLTRKCFERTCDFIAITHDPDVIAGLSRLFDADAKTGSAVDPGALPARLIIGPECARERLSALLSSATDRIRIIDHKLTDPGMVSLLNERRAAGIDVTVIREELRGLKPHGKLLLIDGKAAVIGSLSLAALNLDFRREVALVVPQPSVVRSLGEWFAPGSASMGEVEKR